MISGSGLRGKDGTAFEQDIKTNDRQSSKGNQLKWCRNNVWYKADYMGYEGLVEYVVSRLLEKSSLKQEEYVLYKTEEISYKRRKYLGCKSENFLPEGWQLITLERLFMDFIMKVFIKNYSRFQNIRKDWNL